MAVIRIKRTAVLVLTAALGVFVLVLSNGIRQGVIKGITLCGSSVIPSLFLFTSVSLFAVNSGILQGFNKITPLSQRVFGLKGNELSVFALSLTAGYPVGAKMVNELYKNGEITHKKANRMLLFCVGAGPAFTVTAVGEQALGSKQDGIRLLCATLVSSVLMAALSRFVEKKEKSTPKPKEKAPEIPLSDAFVLSVSDAAGTMLKVSAFVVVFSGLLGGLNSLCRSYFMQKYMFSLLEVTSGVQNFGRGELYAVAFLIGFGGLSVHLQIMSSAGEIRPKYFRVFLSRLVHGLMSTGFVLLFDWLWPRTVETAATGGAAKPEIHGNPMSAAAMLLLAATVAAVTIRLKHDIKRNTPKKHSL